MRLLLDAHVSGPVVGRRLQAAGHDAFALDQHPELEAMDDQDVLALAAAERRILITHNVAHFPPILREWAAAGRSHSGAILVHGIAHHEFDLLVRGIQRWLDLRPNQDQWLDCSVVLDRRFASEGSAIIKA